VQFYVSYHGGPAPGVNNVDLVDENGPVTKNVLATKLPKHVTLDELRGLAFGPDGALWVVSGGQSASQILRFEAKPGKSGVHAFIDLVAEFDTLRAIVHPFDLAFGPGSTDWYVSNQDTNVVAGPLPATFPNPRFAPAVSQYLQAQYPSGCFLYGTFVASSEGGLEGYPTMAVPPPEGLATGYSKGKLSHSVRGLAHDADRLYVADEAANQVKGYDATGALDWQFPNPVDTTVVDSPVHLLLDGADLLIGSSGGTSQVVRVDIASSTVKDTTPAPSVSGIAFDSTSGTLYAGNRIGCRIFSGTEGTALTAWGKRLTDEPEFILPAP
jgi:hypothetical protein